MPGVGVAGERRQADGGGAQVGVLLGGEGDALRLLDDLLVAPLQAAVADAGGPHGAVVIGDQLHLDVAGLGHDALEEHRRVAERLATLRPGALEGGDELVGLVDRRIPRPPPPAAALTISGKPIRWACAGRLDRVDGAVAPRRDRHLGLLGQSAWRRSCRRARITSGGGPTKTTPSRSQSSANSGRSATKPQPTQAASARPRVSASLERGEVEVRAARRCPVASDAVEAHRLVRLADEHRRALGVGAGRWRREVGAGGETQLAHGVDQAHRRFAAVDDGDPSQIPQIADVHRPRI